MTVLASMPKYQRIAKEIHQRIRVGEFRERLPSRQELASSYQVNGRTIDKALDLLEPEQIIERRRGLGVFVHPRLRGVVVRDFYFVFPGHRATLAGENPYHRVLKTALDEMLTASHELSLEPRLLPIDPDHTGDISWNLLAHLTRGDTAVFVTPQYEEVTLHLAERGVKCVIVLSGGDDLDLMDGDLPIMCLDSDYTSLAMDIMGRIRESGGQHLAFACSLANPSKSYLMSRLAVELEAVMGDSSIRWDWELDQQSVGATMEELVSQVQARLRRQPTLDSLIATSPDEAKVLTEAVRGLEGPERREVQIFCLDTLHHLDTSVASVVYHHDVETLVGLAMAVAGEVEPFQPGVHVVPFGYLTADGAAGVVEMPDEEPLP